MSNDPNDPAALKPALVLIDAPKLALSSESDGDDKDIFATTRYKLL